MLQIDSYSFLQLQSPDKELISSQLCIQCCATIFSACIFLSSSTFCRQNTVCPDDGLIRAWLYQTLADDQVQMDYNCCKPAVAGAITGWECEDTKTPTIEYTNFDSVTMDR